MRWKRRKKFAIALWFSQKSMHNTLTRIFRHSNFFPALFDVLDTFFFISDVSASSKYITIAFDVMLISDSRDNIRFCFNILLKYRKQSFHELYQWISDEKPIFEKDSGIFSACVRFSCSHGCFSAGVIGKKL